MHNNNILISLSIFNVFLWLLCTTFSAMILIRFNSANSLIKLASLDLISPGVWGSLFYGLAGILGICAAYERRQPLLVATLVLAMLSIFSSLGIAAVSGAMATWPRFRSYNNPTWLGLEWTLLVLSALGLVVNVSVFVSVSVLICRTPNNRKNNAPPAPCSNNNLEMPLLPPPPGFIIPPIPPHQKSYNNPSSLDQVTYDTNM